MSSAAAGIGAFGWGTGSLRGILFISGLALVAWATWALVTFEIGTRLMPEARTRADQVRESRYRVIPGGQG